MGGTSVSSCNARVIEREREHARVAPCLAWFLLIHPSPSPVLSTDAKGGVRSLEGYLERKGARLILEFSLA